jgi:hypothetical protein
MKPLRIKSIFAYNHSHSITKYRISVKQTFQYKHFPSDYRKTARIFNVLEKNTKHLSKKFLNGEYAAWNSTKVSSQSWSFHLTLLAYPEYSG